MRKRIAIGAAQFASGTRNLVNRARGQVVSNNTYVQVAYKYAAQKITGCTDSRLEQTLDTMYFSAEVLSACATGTISIRGSIAAVRSIGLERTAKRWTDVNGYLRMEFYMTASVSTVEAGGVVATETFSTTMSAMSFFSSPTNDVETIDIEKGAYEIHIDIAYAAGASLRLHFEWKRCGRSLAAWRCARRRSRRA